MISIPIVRGPFDGGMLSVPRGTEAGLTLDLSTDEASCVYVIVVDPRGPGALAVVPRDPDAAAFDKRNIVRSSTAGSR